MPDNIKEEKKTHNNKESRETAQKRQYEQIPPAPPGRPIAAFVLGIASIALCPLPFMLIAAVAGLLLEKESERTGYHKLQKPARILCVTGIVLCSVAIAVIITALIVLKVISG